MYIFFSVHPINFHNTDNFCFFLSDSKGESWYPINWCIPATLLCLSQGRTWTSKIICGNLISIIDHKNKSKDKIYQFCCDRVMKWKKNLPIEIFGLGYTVRIYTRVSFCKSIQGLSSCQQLSTVRCIWIQIIFNIFTEHEFMGKSKRMYHVLYEAHCKESINKIGKHNVF